MQAARPKVLIAPLQIGLGVSVHHLTGSKHLVDQLHSLGFSSSYTEVKTFELSASLDQKTSLVGVGPNSSIQFMADNVDHQIRTLDGAGTFHGMGILAASTPGSKDNKTIRREISATPAKISAIGKVPIRYYCSTTTDLKLAYDELKYFNTDDKTWKLDLLWKLSWPLRSPRPGWSGYMQSVQTGNYPGQSSFTFLPIIDMNPTDMSCIFSTLHFVSSLAARHNTVPVLTFDQPLWWKATTIIDSESQESVLRSIVLRLGPFHTEMSFLGSIGRLMAGTGLEQVLQTIFAANSVHHILSGKSVSRAVRGHFLIDTVLTAIIASDVFNFSLQENNSPEEWEDCQQISECWSLAQPVGIVGIAEPATSQQDPFTTERLENDKELENCTRQSSEYYTSREALTMVGISEPSICQLGSSSAKEIEKDKEVELEHTRALHQDLHAVLTLFDKVMDKDMSAEQLIEGDFEEIGRVYSRLLEAKDQLNGSRTSRIWLQYMDMIDILKRFLKAERTGDWWLHLKSLQDMLPFLAAAGHSQYTKSVYVYLQKMKKLEEEHPSVFHAFTSGFHVLRRSDRFWAGLSTDLVIEQVLMKNLKSAGGLTRGRGIGDTQRTQWLMSMPACADMCNAMQRVTGTELDISQQHSEVSDARQTRDDKDMRLLLSFLKDRNPFASDQTLRNISTGVTAHRTVNADKAKDVGEAILQTMQGKPVTDFTFKRKDQVVSMDTKITAKMEGENIQVNPQLLFQRMITAANADDFELPSVLKYELTTPPPSLFEPSGLMREAHKSKLSDSMRDLLKDVSPSKNEYKEMVTILDGGSLLHKIPWKKKEPFSAIFNRYGEYVNRRYSKPIVVFDGYESGPSVKDAAHLRRSAGVVGPAVIFTKDMPLTSSKENFLSNPKNKQEFVHLLSSTLAALGCHCLHAAGDADTLIVKTAMEYAATHPTAVIGEDTDLLVLLCHHAQLSSRPIIFRSDRKASSNHKCLNIQDLKEKLGEETCHLLPFIHAVNGCDSTSRLFGLGKLVPMRKMTDGHFRKQAHIFCTAGNTQEDIIYAGERALVSLYNGTTTDTLDQLRYKRFCVRVESSATSVQIQCLPPTSSAAKYHSLRVYLQVQEWMSLSPVLHPEQWGWQLHDDHLEPCTTDLPPAPHSLLKVIKCSCRTDCNSTRCTCRRHGLECSISCGGCKGLTCSNCPSLPEEDDISLLEFPVALDTLEIPDMMNVHDLHL